MPTGLKKALNCRVCQKPIEVGWYCSDTCHNSKREENGKKVIQYLIDYIVENERPKDKS
jgi:predicted nucleic acid-binding Zn ribbon protein